MGGEREGWVFRSSERGSSGYQSAPHRRPISVASETTREPYLSLTVSTPQPNLSPHLPRHPPLPRAHWSQLSGAPFQPLKPYPQALRARTGEGCYTTYPCCTQIRKREREREREERASSVLTVATSILMTLRLSPGLPLTEFATRFTAFYPRAPAGPAINVVLHPGNAEIYLFSPQFMGLYRR